jgi:hypothetical protein
VHQEERSIFWEVIVSAILSRIVYPIPNCFRDGVISLYSSKIVDKKEILHTLSNNRIYCSSERVGTVYLVQNIFENSTVNMNALCNLCDDMACCSSVQCTYCADGNRSEQDTCTYTFILLRMTDTVSSQNADLSSWDTLHNQPTNQPIISPTHVCN